MKRVLHVMTGLLAALSAQAGAASFSAQGTLAFHNEVTFIPLSMAEDAVDIRIWTDSFRGGLNIDPIVALWRDGQLLDQNDDFPYLDPLQTWYDAGLFLPRLDAGNYVLSVTRFANFAVGPRMTDGFDLDADTPSALEHGYWQVHMLTDSPLPPVPEPSQPALLLAGAALLTALRARRKHILRRLPRVKPT